MVWILPQDLAYVPCQAYVSSGVAESEQLDVEFMQACTIHCTTNVNDILYSHFPSIPTPPYPVRGGGGVLSRRIGLTVRTEFSISRKIFYGLSPYSVQMIPRSSRYVFRGYCVLLLILLLDPVGYFHFSHFFGHIGPIEKFLP